MSSPSAATSAAIPVLIADSNRMQAQLLTSALRRHSEFRIATCPMNPSRSFRPSPPNFRAWPCSR